jgi:hypoxanthine phosphoribosyltransferase
MSPSQPRELISTEKLETRIAEMAAQIEYDYREQDPPLCIGVLKGTVFFMVDLLKRINLPLQVDFLQTSSYGSGTQAGEVRILKDVEIAIRGRNVLLIEDIVDTGFTLNTVLALLRFRGARSVKLCAMLDKRAARQIEVEIDYCGFEIDDVFVIGYGLDVDERYRNLPYIGVFEGE